MDSGELLTRWTVRFALLLYLAGLVLRVSASGRGSRLKGARLAWTAGFFVFLLHVACAFQFFYGWSNMTAYAATARRTQELVGIDWGGGLYANYAFTLLWAADVCWWWYDPGSYGARPRAVEGAVQGFLGFIAFNGAVVFGEGAIRWLGLAACLVLAGACGRKVWRRMER
jgi:hypothetical protein